MHLLEGETARRVIGVVIGGVVASVALTLGFVGKKTNFEDAATFGAKTSSVEAQVDGFPIHCHDSRDAASCLEGSKKRGAQSTVLWLGNSQVHAVNEWQPGQTNAAPMLFDLLKARQLDLMTFSQPNANLQEHLVLFENLRRKLQVKVLLLPVVFDDMREDGLRKTVADFLEDADTKNAIAATEVGNKILQANQTAPASERADTAGLAHTIQERVELALNRWLELRSELWAIRPEIRGQIMTNLHLLRNTALGITPSSKRKVIKSRYQANAAALETILRSASENNIKVAMYVVPLRNDVEVPYVRSEYEHYKIEMDALAKKHNASFTNLENIVPASMWGAKDAASLGGGQELDFMHFKEAGHKLLSAELFEVVKKAMVAREAAK